MTTVPSLSHQLAKRLHKDLYMACDDDFINFHTFLITLKNYVQVEEENE